VEIKKLLKDDGTLVCERCSLATSALARMRGLLGRSSLAQTAEMAARRASRRAGDLNSSGAIPLSVH